MTPVEVGDWVCYQQCGVPTYGLVLYVNVRGAYRMVVTTCGECREKDVLEIRREETP